jgi:hypothetical protein
MDLRIPPIRYADNDGIEIAYQVIGDSGPVFMGLPGLAQNIELMCASTHPLSPSLPRLLNCPALHPGAK